MAFCFAPFWQCTQFLLACIALSCKSMDVDRSLIAAPHQRDNTIVDCHDWGKRRRLYDSDHTVRCDDGLSDSAIDAARIRARYNNPSSTRRSVGKLAAHSAGFKTIAHGSTVTGDALYQARGDIEHSRQSGGHNA